MKKTYIMPVVAIVRVEQAVSLLAGSEVGVNVMGGSADKDADVLSRRRSGWDDEDYD